MWALREADSLEVISLVDNYTDVFKGQDTKIDRRTMTKPPAMFLAEHGFSCFLRVRSGSEEHMVLFDTGVSPDCLFHNAKLLNIKLENVESIVLSHGHFDHTGGLLEILNRTSKKIPLVLHPDAFLDRHLKNPALSQPVDLPSLEEESLRRSGANVVKSKEPSVLASGLIMATGQVERLTPFERGFPGMEAKINGEWVVDPFNDDQGLVVNLKDRGLIIIGGCSHAGIINTVNYAKKIVETDKIHAVLGGFHLTGPAFEPIIGITIDEMKKMNPTYIAPMHCTGWNAINQFKEKMPGQAIINTVGTIYTFN
jgi:7,8-dihydropterin-6-yl-methyl-4-(beta-D-ribofuranosyl)aminobenzene 5'-phosphate synthase